MQHYHAPTGTIGPLPPRVGLITNFPKATAETHRAHGYHPVLQTVYVEGEAPSVAYDHETQVATVTRLPAPPPAPEPLTDGEFAYIAACQAIGLPGHATGPEIQEALSHVPPDVAVMAAMGVLAGAVAALEDATGNPIATRIREKLSQGSAQ